MDTKNIPGRMYTIKEVAEILGVCVRQAQRLAQEGAIPAVKVGRLYRVSRKRLAEFMGEA